MTQYFLMSESSNAVNAATLSYHYGGGSGSRNGYNTYDGYFALPNYTTHAPPRNYVISQVDVLE